MKLSHFNFDLPEELLAEYPAENRDESRLMVLHRDTQKIEHRMFKDLIDYFDEKDVMILNNTKVFPARWIIIFGSTLSMKSESACSFSTDILLSSAISYSIGLSKYFVNVEPMKPLDPVIIILSVTP